MDSQRDQENRVYTLRSRRIVFERELKSLSRLMYGETARVWFYMTDAAGKYSEEQTMKLIDQILDEAYVESGCVQQLSFCRAALYCVLRTLTSGYTEYRMGNIAGFKEPSEVSFSDVIISFEDSSPELLDNHTAHFVEALYDIFSQKEAGRKVSDPEELTEERKRQIDEEWESRTAAENALAKEQGVDMEAVRAWEQEEAKRWELQGIEEKERVRRSFAEQLHFCRSVEEMEVYRKKHPANLGALGADLRDRIRRFLSDREHAVFDKEDEFVAVMVQLKKTIRTAQRFLED